MKLVVRSGEREETVRVERHGDRYRVSVGEAEYEVDAADLGGGRRSLLIGGRQHEVAVHPLPPPPGATGHQDGRYRVSRGAARPAVEVEIRDPLTHLARQSHASAAGGGRRQVTALMPGRVVAILAPEGTEVAAGQGVVVLEAMKMENEIAAEHGGVVKTMFVQEGQAVDGSEPLFEIAAAGDSS
jgi:glutaconyl-CoA/methylmalonyl-CoA decarboxylase subunit gamma